MIVMRTLLGLALAAPGVHAADRDPVASLAGCAGRYSAELEHAWLVGGDAPEPIEDRRDEVLALLERVTDPAQAVRALDLRIRAKHAHARLLLHARFHTDPAVASRSRRLATMGIRICRTMLLG